MSRREGEPNRLAHEPSLYLQQHANNPVDWYAWGDEAFAEAERRGVPVIVSVGYSSCHWCHVMERESFEDAQVAAYQNEHFVSIKVDREERPDIDRLYMTACQVITKQGGWPLNAFALPDGRPFYAGTYFPPTPRSGRPSWRELLEMLHESWTERRDELEESAEELMDIIRRHGTPTAAPAVASDGVLNDARTDLSKQFDLRNGGFGTAPKFPNAATLQLLARTADGLSDDALHSQFDLTLSKMADGGIFDHIGGGFARYSTDAIWLVPHFEKMLYDNGQLLSLYAYGYSRTQDPRYAETIQHTAAWLEREMRSPCGAYYATLDADSEGEEGTFYVWSVTEFDALFPGAAQPWRDFFGLSKRGNFEDTGKNVLSRAQPLTDLAKRLRVDGEGTRQALEHARRALLTAREKRERPARDEKRITAWNALTLQGLARSAMALADADLEALAVRVATAITGRLWDGDTLLRVLETRPDGTPHRIEGFLDDYAYLADALVDLALLTQDPSWLALSSRLCERITELFYNEKLGQLCLAHTPREAIAAAMPAAHDDATPAPSGIAIRAMQRVAMLTETTTFDGVIDRVIAAAEGDLARYPMAVASLAIAADNRDRGLRMAIAATENRDLLDEQTRRATVAELATHLSPDDVFWLGRPSEPVAEALFEQRTSDRGLLWYVCRGTRCGLPAPELLDAVASLDSAD